MTVTFKNAKIGDKLYFKEGDSPDNYGCLYVGDAKYIIKTGSNSYDGYSADGTALGDCSGCLEDTEFDIEVVASIRSGDVVFIDTTTTRYFAQFSDSIGKMGIVSTQGDYCPMDTKVVVSAYRPKHLRAYSLSLTHDQESFYKENAYDFEQIFKFEDEVKELTLEEIADKFEVDVSKIRIKE